MVSKEQPHRNTKTRSRSKLDHISNTDQHTNYHRGQKIQLPVLYYINKELQYLYLSYLHKELSVSIVVVLQLAGVPEYNPILVSWW